MAPARARARPASVRGGRALACLLCLAGLVGLVADEVASAGAQAAGAPPVPGSGGHTATALDDGRVLVVSGRQAAIYDPQPDRWLAVDGPAAPRTASAAVLLPGGRVLVAGGHESEGSRATAEVFDPATRRWEAVAPMARSRLDHTATLLADGSVLVAGGRQAGHGPFVAEAERYDPASGTWRAAGTMPLGRAFHTATRLADGRVLVTGGQGTPHDRSLRDALVFDPAADSWTPVPQLMSVGRARHTATPLPDSTVLLAGGTRQREGQQAGDLEASAEIYDPGSSSFRPTASLRVGRAAHAAVAVPGAGVLAVGGEAADSGGDPEAAPSAVEAYEPATRRWSALPPAGRGAVVVTATLLEQGCGPRCGHVLVVGVLGATVYALPGRPAGDPGAGPGGGNSVPWPLVGGLAALAFLAALWIRRRGRPAAPAR